MQFKIRPNAMSMHRAALDRPVLRSLIALATVGAAACQSGVPSAPLSVSPADTSVYLGAFVQLHATGVEAFEAGPGASITSDGVITTSSLGRHYIVAHGDSLRDTVWISTVPEGTLLAGLNNGVGLVDLDGSHRRMILPQPEAQLAWAPDGQHFTYTDQTTPYPQTMISDLAGTTQVLVPYSVFYFQAYPRVRYDGKAVYLQAGIPNDGPWSLFRVGIDGSGLTHIVTASAVRLRNPDAAHTSDRVVVMRPNGLGVIDPDAGTESAWSYPADYGFWSPDDDVIAAESSTLLALINPETGAVVDSIGAYSFESWSPDGKWMILDSPKGRTLFNRVTRQEILLPPWARDLGSPRWRPSQ